MGQTKQKILYVEDESTLRTITSELLSLEGFDCRQAMDGIEAQAMLEAEEFDLLITDFRMPRMDGSELMIWCRKNHKHLPVIFMTGAQELLPIERTVLNDCCASVLVKPVSFDSLLEAIRDAMERNHEFECKGKFFRIHDSNQLKDFPGQHYF